MKFLVNALLLVGTSVLFLAPTETSALKGSALKPAASTVGRRRLDNKKAPKKRDCKTALEEDEFTFECKSKTEDGGTEIKDEIDFSVEKSRRGIVVKIKYEQEIENEVEDSEKEDKEQDDGEDSVEADAEGDAEVDTEDEERDVQVQMQVVEETETETKYEVVFDRLIEYAKASETGVQAYEWDQDEVVQTISLLDWGSFSEITEDANTGLSSFSVSSLDGTSTFRFTIARAAEGEAVSANKMKIDFNLVGFPWIRSDTYVALVSNIETEREVEVEYASGEKEAIDVVIDFAEDAVGASGLMPFGEFTWATVAEASANSTDNTTTVMDTIEVVATSSPTRVNPNTETIAFSFVGGSAKSAMDIYWDPEAGVGYTTVASGSIRLGVVTAFGFVGALLAVLFA